MYRFVSLFAVPLAVAALASAQENPATPIVEVGLNYSFVHATSPEGQRQLTSNGGSGYVTYNWNHIVGLVADFGAYHNGARHGLLENSTTFTYLFGPRFNWRISRFNPYVQFLFGGARTSADTSVNGTTVSPDGNGFATAAGGGIDIALTNFLAFKPIQVEYLMAQVPDLATDRLNFQNDLRYSAGVVLRFGKK